MVCHETYKDNNDNWLFPSEVDTKNGKDFFLKDNPSEKVKVGPSESMSKSKKNTIDPQNIINIYGADAVRFFILSDSPPEKDVQWSEQGMLSAYKFVQKFWLLHEKIMNNILVSDNDKHLDEEIEKFINQLVFKITKNLENFHYNVIIANLHEVYNFLSKVVEKINDQEKFKKNYIKILKVMFPVMPHLMSECLSQLEVKENLSWPNIDEKHLINEKINIVIQINGKKRDLITLEKSMDKNQLIELIKKNEKIQKFVMGKTIKKTVYVQDKLINLII